MSISRFMSAMNKKGKKNIEGHFLAHNDIIKYYYIFQHYLGKYNLILKHNIDTLQI